MYNRSQEVRAMVAIASMVPLLSCSEKGSAPRVDPEPDVEDQIDSLEAEVGALRNQPISFSPSTLVGTLPGSSSVDPGGQAMYSIPIEVAPGAAGLTPELAITPATVVTAVGGARSALGRSAFFNGRGLQEDLFGEAKQHAALGYIPCRRLVPNQLYVSSAMLHNLSRERQCAPVPSNAARLPPGPGCNVRSLGTL
jgi:hypothetical protein